MRSGSRQLAGSMRTAVLVSACLALVATTSGLLLALHILYADHAHNHDSDDCAICQQLLATSKKPALAPQVERMYEAPGFCTDAPQLVEHVEHRLLQVAQPRGPPCSCEHPSF